MAKYVQPTHIVDSSASFLKNAAFDSSVFLMGTTFITSPVATTGTPYALVVATIGDKVQVKSIQLGTMATKQSADYDASINNIDSSIAALDSLTRTHTTHLSQLDASIIRIDASLNTTIDALTIFSTIAYVDGSLNAKVNKTLFDSSVGAIWTKFGSVDTSISLLNNWDISQDASIVALRAAGTRSWNGLTTTDNSVGLGGTLNLPTTITTSATNSLKIAGLVTSTANTPFAVVMEGVDGSLRVRTLGTMAWETSTNYYGKTAVDGLIAPFATNASVGLALGAYATNTSVNTAFGYRDTSISGIWTKLGYHDTSLNGIWTQFGYVNSSLNGLDASIKTLNTAISNVNSSLGLYVTNTSIGLALGPYATNSSVGLAIAPFATNVSVGLALGAYATNASIGTAAFGKNASFGLYATNASVGLALGAYTTNVSINTALGAYATNVSIGTAAFAKNASLSLYVQKAGDTMTGPLSITGGGLSVTNDVSITGGLYVNTNATVKGNLTINGSLYVVGVEEIDVSAAYIHLNTGLVGAPPASLQSGIIIERGSSEPYVFLFDESYDEFRIGVATETSTGFLDTSTQAVLTREDSPTSFGIGFWDGTKYRIDTSAGFTFTPGVGLGLPIATSQGTEKTVLSLVAGTVGSVELGTMAFETSTNYYGYTKVNALINDVSTQLDTRLDFVDTSIRGLNTLTIVHTAGILDLSTNAIRAVANIGVAGTASIFQYELNNIAYLKKLVQGTGITITEDTSTITITSTGAAGFVSKYKGTFDGTAASPFSIPVATHGLGVGPLTVAVYESLEQVYTGVSCSAIGDVTLTWTAGSLTDASCKFVITG